VRAPRRTRPPTEVVVEVGGLVDLHHVVRIDAGGCDPLLEIVSTTATPMRDLLVGGGGGEGARREHKEENPVQAPLVQVACG
jgi:hypothetical protein